MASTGPSLPPATTAVCSAPPLLPTTWPALALPTLLIARHHRPHLASLTGPVQPSRLYPFGPFFYHQQGRLALFGCFYLVRGAKFQAALNRHQHHRAATIV